MKLTRRESPLKQHEHHYFLLTAESLCIVFCIIFFLCLCSTESFFEISKTTVLFPISCKMHALKDKVTDRISRLFSPSSAPVDGSQDRSYSFTGKSLSSIFSYIVPSHKAEKLKPKKYEDDIKPIQSEPVHWNNKGFEWREEHFQSGVGVRGDHNRETASSQDNNIDQPSRLSTSGSDVLEEAPDPHSPVKSMPDLTEESSFISPNLYEFLHSCIPNIVKGCQWVLLYSTLKHGISLRTLIRKSADHSGPCLLIAGDLQGAVFGGLLECPLNPTVKRKYQGTIQTFVFTTIYGEPRLFRPTGANRYFYLCLNDLLALGGGGNFALRLDGDLLNGASGPCDTFGNLCLAHTPEFELKNVELWGFAHTSQYIP